jgi:hypothetical protein
MAASEFAVDIFRLRSRLENAALEGLPDYHLQVLDMVIHIGLRPPVFQGP